MFFVRCRCTGFPTNASAPFESVEALARLIQSELAQNDDVIFRLHHFSYASCDASLHVTYSAAVLECTTLLIR